VSVSSRPKETVEGRLRLVLPKPKLTRFRCFKSTRNQSQIDTPRSVSSAFVSPCNWRDWRCVISYDQKWQRSLESCRSRQAFGGGGPRSRTECIKAIQINLISGATVEPLFKCRVNSQIDRLQVRERESNEKSEVDKVTGSASEVLVKCIKSKSW
jgi:hypothetical protein